MRSGSAARTFGDMVPRLPVRSCVPLFLLAALAVPVLAVPALAQAPVSEGNEVRLTLRSGATVEGILHVGLRADSLHVAVGGEVVGVGVGDLEMFEVRARRSRGRGLLRGAGFGALAGGVGGGALGVLSHGGDDRYISKGALVVVAGVVFGTLGAVVGGVIGLAAPGERWVPVTGGAPSGSPVPDAGSAVELGFRIPFR